MRRTRFGVMLLVGVVAACGQAAISSPAGSTVVPASPSASTSAVSASPSATPEPTASASPTLTASPTPAASAAPVKVGRIATVVTNDLRVRTKPSVSADSLKLTPLLDNGREVYVVKGPKAGSGYQWYEVQPIRRPGEETAMPFGWIAAADKDGEQWVDGGRFDCPKAPATWRALQDLPPLVGAACFSRKKLSFPARLEQPEATCGVDIGWTIEPDWLASTCPQPKFLIADTKSTESFFPVLDPGLKTGSLDPGVDEPDWIDVTVTGHFDDKAATTCKGKSTEAGTKVPIGRDEIITSCRGQFVITSIKPRG